MKSLKLDHDAAVRVAAGKQTSTWRINDDKDLHVNDVVQLIDKVDSNDPATWVPITTVVITSILEKQLGSVLQSDLTEGEKLPAQKDLLAQFRTYYGQQVTLQTPVKIIRFTVHSQSSNHVPSSARYILHADGGSRGNPGPSASGFVIQNDTGTVVAEKGVFLGVTTNNQAEYQALKLGLEEARRLGCSKLEVFMDSMLVVNQMNGRYKVKNSDLLAIHRSIQQLKSTFQQCTISYVPRERNKAADAIVNQVLDAA